MSLLGFASHTVRTVQLCHCSMKGVRDNMDVNWRGWAPIKFIHQNRRRDMGALGTVVG